MKRNNYEHERELLNDLMDDVVIINRDSDKLLTTMAKKLSYADDMGLRDVTATLKAIDIAVYSICCQRAQIEYLLRDYASFGIDIAVDPDNPIVSILNGKDYYGIRTPYIRRSTCTSAPTALPFEDLMRLQFACVDPVATHLNSDPEIVIYSVSVYPLGTKRRHILDNDNQIVKQPIDLITKRLHREDKSDVTTLVMGAIVTDALTPGTYTFATSKSAGVIPVEEAITIVLADEVASKI